MLQLIYTSAPRLLEAGKTGFGTVARSRQLPQFLITYLERISTYDRAAGVESLQCYSVFSQGMLRYHIFTRIGDSGVDYTQRTNHIAHHFIIQDDEVSEGALASVTPAAFMMSLQHKWKTQWSGNPAWIEEESEEVPDAQQSASLWQHLTGNADNSQWLSTQTCEEGVNIVLPAGCGQSECLTLIHEATMHRCDKGWGMGFSTATVTTLSSKVCPCVCLSEQQVHAGVQPRSGFPTLQVDHQLAPPTAVDFPPMMEISELQSIVPEAPVAPNSSIIHSLTPPAPTSIAADYPTPTPLQAEAQATVSQNPYQTGKRQGDNQPAMQKYGWSIAGCFILMVIIIFALAFEKDAAKEKPEDSQKPAEEGYTFDPDKEPRQGKNEVPAPKDNQKTEDAEAEPEQETPAPKDNQKTEDAEAEPEQEDSHPKGDKPKNNGDNNSKTSNRVPEQHSPEQKPHTAPSSQQSESTTHKECKTYKCAIQPDEVSIVNQDKPRKAEIKIEFTIDADSLRSKAPNLGSSIYVRGKGIKADKPCEINADKPCVAVITEALPEKVKLKIKDEQDKKRKLDKANVELSEKKRQAKSMDKGKEDSYRKDPKALEQAIKDCKKKKDKEPLQQLRTLITLEKKLGDAKEKHERAKNDMDKAIQDEIAKYKKPTWELHFTYQKEAASYTVNIVDIVKTES